MTFRRDSLHDKYWKPLLKRDGLPNTRFHDLRHTCATLRGKQDRIEVGLPTESG